MLFYIKEGCPNCQNIISDQRLKNRLPCEQCIQEKVTDIIAFEKVCKSLNENKKLKNLKAFCEATKKTKTFKNVFKKLIGNNPSSLQVGWAKRYFLGESFAIIAPTGTGKSTFGFIACLLHPKKSLIVVPTKVLVKQVEDKILNFKFKNKKVLAYKGNKKEKQQLISGDFDIFICTSNFMHRNFQILKQLDFSLIFIDDINSILKSNKSVINLFLLLGFTKEEIDLALSEDKPESFNNTKKLNEKRLKQLIVSSATLRPSAKTLLLFRKLLGFEITRFTSTLRKVIDTFYTLKNPSKNLLFEKALKIVKELGQGGLIFVEEGLGKTTVQQLTEYLRNNGIKAVSYLDVKESELLKLISNEEIEVAVGLCHLSNPLVRGLDFPYTLKYALFLGVPKHLFAISKQKDRFVLPLSIQHIYNILISITPLLDEEEKLTVISYVNYLKKYITIKKEEDLLRYEHLYKRVLKIKEFTESKLNDPNLIQKLQESNEIFLKVIDGGYYIVVGNANAYIQASGRVSRLTTKGLLPGLSIILVDDLKAFNSLKRRMRFFVGQEHDFLEVDFVKIKKLFKKILKEREELKKENIDFKNYLIVVESPHKAKTIASFFGKPSVRRINNLLVYEIPMENVLVSICASLGHIFNLSRKTGIFGVVREDSHFYPVFSSIKIDKKTGQQFVDAEEVKQKDAEIYDKGEIIKALRYLAFCSDFVFVASDPDTEGEKIAYDIYINLRPFQENIKRLEFHEITPRAFKEALNNPKEINILRVKAQLARRVADRWVGFSLSQKLWEAFNKKYLSAGRVQSPVLGWVIERTEKAKERKFVISFELNSHNFLIETEDSKLAKDIENELKQNLLKVVLLEEKEQELMPPSPYTTDKVLEDAFYYFRFSASLTMDLLQELFELGLITYHRTDSTTISEAGRFLVARPYIIEHLGEDYFYPREWKTEGAHEGIRPTKPWDLKELKIRLAHGFINFKDTSKSLKLYDIIFKRFMASQTRKVSVKKGIFEFRLPCYSWKEELILQVLRPGFEVFWKNFDVWENAESLNLKNIEIKKVPKVPLYNQGSLIQEMKKRGLGRPSTYAEIVLTLINRHYLYELKNGALVPTKLGKEVYFYLKEHFGDYISEEFTRQLEEFMDTIETQDKNWEEICYKILPLLPYPFN